MIKLRRRAGFFRKKVANIIEQVAQAVASTRAGLSEHVNQSPAFKDIPQQPGKPVSPIKQRNAVNGGHQRD